MDRKIAKVLQNFLNMDDAKLRKHVFFIQDFPSRAGRGVKIPEERGEVPHKYVDKLNLGCMEIGKTIAIHPDGSVHVCCGHAPFDVDDLNAGNIKTESLSSILNRMQRNLMYWWIHMQDPKKILDEVIGRNDEYSSICDACVVMFKKHRDAVYGYLDANRDEVFLNGVLLSDNVRRYAEILTE